MTSLKEICDKHDYDYSNIYDEYESVIVNLFNSPINMTDDNMILQSLPQPVPQLLYIWLGRYYRDVKQDYVLSTKYLLIGVEMNCASCMNVLGTHYMDIEQNYDFAKYYFLMAINHNLVYAMYNLGEYYYDIEKDYGLAKQYFLMAVERGCIESTYKLGILYYDIEKDCELAKQYLLMAVERGCIDSMRFLGTIYYDSKDYVQSKHYYSMATERGCDYACHNLGLLYYYIEKDYVLAKHYYLISAKNDCCESMNNLGDLCYHIEKDMSQAKQYYLMAIKNGYNDYKNIIAMLINIGFTEPELDLLVEYCKSLPELLNYIKQNYELFGICDMLYIYNKLELSIPSDSQAYKFLLKQKHFAKQLLCDICASNTPTECIPFNWCNHYICVKCYHYLYAKPCPFCRCEF